jgi:hypothetical protein
VKEAGREVAGLPGRAGKSGMDFGTTVRGWVRELGDGVRVKVQERWCTTRRSGGDGRVARAFAGLWQRTKQIGNEVTSLPPAMWGGAEPASCHVGRCKELWGECLTQNAENGE